MPPLSAGPLTLRRLSPLLLSVAMVLLCAGPASALPYYELERPGGEGSNRLGRGVVLVVHGGSWQDTGRSKVRHVAPVAQRFRDRGFTTLNHTYRPGGKGILDVRAFYRRARALAGPRRPVCLWGESSGAHWGALLASEYEVDCTVAEGLPTLKVPQPARRSRPSTYPRSTCSGELKPSASAGRRPTTPGTFVDQCSWG